MSIDAKRRYAAAAFVTLLVLSVFWPSPIVSMNRLSANRDLAIDELSFLGREALAWDVVFWCIAGLLAIAIWQTREPSGAGVWTAVKASVTLALRRGDFFLALGAVVIISITWFFVDTPVLRWAETIQSDTTESIVRILNRLGGGGNPPLIVIFFLLAGIAYQQRRWVWYAVAMAIAGLGAGLVAHIFKLLVGRTRPELWLGAFHYARGGANSFPSGHTVGAFALAGVLLFTSPSIAARIVAVLLASSIGLSRILAFRHWPSDVVASALIGLFCAWVVTRPRRQSSRSQDVSSPPLPS